MKEPIPPTEDDLLISMGYGLADKVGRRANYKLMMNRNHPGLYPISGIIADLTDQKQLNAAGRAHRKIIAREYLALADALAKEIPTTT